MANPSSPAIVAKMMDGSGELGYIDTPKQQNHRPPGVTWCADNGCFSAKWKQEPWWAFLQRHAHEAATCLFAVAPDVVGDHAATLARSTPWMPKIRALGYKVAFVAQDGVTPDTVLPWADFDVLFIGGTDEFKLGAEAAARVAEAVSLGKTAHLGRVNSYKRLQYAVDIGCTSADGTFLTRAPDHNLGRTLRWFAKLQPPPSHYATT